MLVVLKGVVQAEQPAPHTADIGDESDDSEGDTPGHGMRTVRSSMNHAGETVRYTSVRVRPFFI